MLHWMRKHMRWILIIIMIMVIPAFVVWGGFRKGSGKSKRERKAQEVVATVGSYPIAAAAFRRRLNDEASRRAKYGGERPTYKQMALDGTAERVLDTLIDSVLLEIEADKAGFNFDNDYLSERLKEDPSFQDENGEFDPAVWNQWVSSQENANWNAIYADVSNRLSREMLLKQVMAPARVTDSEIREQFIENYTKLQIRSVAVDPEIEPTEDKIQAQYDENPTRYERPEQRTVEYVTVPLTPPRPPLADQLVERLRAGEDFAELAKEHSDDVLARQGGDMGWMKERENAPANLAALFKLPVGAVSDPIQAGGVYYIYAVDEEKIDEESGERSVKARQIVLKPALDEAEKKAREEQADRIVAKAKETGDLAVAAADAGLTVKTVSGVSIESMELDGIPRTDVYALRGGLVALAEGEISEALAGRENLYIAKVTAVAPAVLQPLEDVRDKVAKDASDAIRRTPERREEVRSLAQKVLDQSGSLEDALKKFPELGLDIKESKEFKRTDWLFADGVQAQTSEIFAALEGKEPGVLAGPVSGFGGQAYLVELVKRIPPSEEDWESEWPEQEKQLRDRALSAKRNMLVMDYLAALREGAGRDNPVLRNWAAINDILGIGPEPEEAAADDEGGEAAAVDDGAEETAPEEPAAGEPPADKTIPEEPAAE
ncbi:MAG: hypothetical protein GWP08_01685 [Nitrospiraceae bacterium]|nr:hypothetical protein [Nitrospiraceae bacterium]